MHGFINHFISIFDFLKLELLQTKIHDMGEDGTQMKINKVLIMRDKMRIEEQLNSL